MKRTLNPKAILHASVRFEIAQALFRLAKRERVTLSALVEDALRIYLRERKAQ